MSTTNKIFREISSFYAYQFGFTKRHSTVQALIELTDNIKRLLDETITFWVFLSIPPKRLIP